MWNFVYFNRLNINIIYNTNMNATIIDEIKNSIRNIPDFPIPGIQFKDLTTLFKEADLLKETVEIIVDYYKDKGITKIVGIESRGFILGGILAYKLNAGFELIRKPGKLPSKTLKKEYSLEYGTNTIEIHEDALSSDDIVLVHDDLLATGGTSRAAIDLIEHFNVKNIYLNFIVELDFLEGRQQINSKYDTYSVIHY